MCKDYLIVRMRGVTKNFRCWRLILKQTLCHKLHREIGCIKFQILFAGSCLRRLEFNIFTWYLPVENGFNLNKFGHLSSVLCFLLYLIEIERIIILRFFLILSFLAERRIFPALIIRILWSQLGESFELEEIFFFWLLMGLVFLDFMFL